MYGPAHACIFMVLDSGAGDTVLTGIEVHTCTAIKSACEGIVD